MSLASIKLKTLHEPADIGDEWRTPHALALGIEAMTGDFSYDLFTDGTINARFRNFITNDQNALAVDWCAMASDDRLPASGFANPPYSRSEKNQHGEYFKGLKECMEKAYEEMLAGFKSVWLVPSATGAGWFPRHTATSIWFLEGRVTFEVPDWYRQDPSKPRPTSARGDSMVVIFDPAHDTKQTILYPKTRDLIKLGKEILARRQARYA
ncbi:DNA N-6-adenine-methyltransferase [Motilimonas sp. 1_MG-2023]|uniref:DNA N-6-adenine-methyltransferase n=1 Tax=Motilimonas sp. 1_MG-2023 TaxID=3062672 RepID=UPI0026E31B2D|nr:DNA N-6-adenine-methyltransferase [Motilimonas sp. 1_MG-2023]MDO6525412.1 DNA N-6-adenine-methyltransferase [Motilimonas sp. 1_MG-2023]